MSRPTHYPVESHLSPLNAHTLSRNPEWWRAAVHSETGAGSGRVRLYLWRNNDEKGWVPKHKWNIQPERWSRQKATIKKYVNRTPNGNPPYFPVQHYTVVGGKTIAKTDDWWTAIVQYEDSWSSTHNTRLYMWRAGDEGYKGTGYKWNISSDTWPEERRIADGLLTNMSGD